MNYDALKMTVKSTLENSFPDFIDEVGNTFSSDEQLNTFIRQAEELIYNTVQPPAIRRNVTGNTIAGGKYVSLPSDYLATFSLSVITDNGEQTFLLNKDVSFIREAYPNPNYTDVPVHYALFDQNSLILGPTPDQNYGLEMHYYYYPASIVDAGTSWLGDNFESVLLYGVLVQAYTHMKGATDMLTVYNNKYGEALALFKLLGDGKTRRDAYRSGQVRVPVQ